MGLTRGQVTTFALTWCTYCLSYFLRKPIAFLKIMLESEFHLSKSDLGWIDVSLLMPYALVQVLGSARLDKYGPSQIIAVCLIVACSATAATGLTHSLGSFCLCLVVSGAAQAPLWPACTKMISKWFPDKVLGTTIGLMSTAPYMGSFASAALVSYISDRSSWRIAFVPIGIAGLLHAILVFTCWREPGGSISSIHSKEDEKEKASNKQQPTFTLAQLWAIPGVVEITVSAFCLKFVRYCLLMWLPLYMSDALGYPKIKTGLVSTLFDIGGIFGGPLLGYLTDRSRHGPLNVVYRAALISGIFLALLMVFDTWGDFGVIIPLFIAGICNCGSDTLLTGSITMELGNRGDRRAGAAVTSLSNGIASFGGIVEGPVVAIVFAWAGWDGVLYLSVVMSLVGAACVFRADTVVKSLDKNGLVSTGSGIIANKV